MKVKAMLSLMTPRDIRNAIVAFVVVGGGLALTALTIFAHATDRPRLAGIAAGLSLISVLLIIIFVVPPLARNAGREASQMDLPFEFTTAGAVMLVLVAVVGFSAWNTGNNLLFLVLSILLAALIVGFLIGGLMLRKLKVKLRFSDVIFADEPTLISVAITNAKRLLPAYSVIVDIRGTMRERAKNADRIEAAFPAKIAARLTQAPIVRRTVGYVSVISARGTATSNVETVFDRRGRFLIKDFEVVTRFPFGFFRHRRRLNADEKELFVLPKRVPVDLPKQLLQADGKRATANRRGFDGELLSLRAYTSADERRRIDWKATARTSTLTVRDLSADEGRRVVVVLDQNLLSTKDEDVDNRRFDNGVSMAASVLIELNELGIEQSLVLSNTDEVPILGLPKQLRKLAVIEPAATSYEHLDLTERINQLAGHNFVILITPNERSETNVNADFPLKKLNF
ncbi:MAG TPA: DUF58 domain-containing protein [Pyrinomonadaceae bacterium]|nr:DUF58 domain-containing protein [Pyrinomonadaceae bacterium]